MQQGQKVRCVDDFTRSGVNACAQVVESPRPHTLDAIAALCMSLMAGPPSKEQWKSRVGHSLCAILVKEFMVAWTNYFDDFVTG